MPISSVGGAGASGNLQSNSMGMQDFLKILLTQLNYQDPMKPMDNQQFMAQMAQFSSLQQTQQLNTNIEKLISNQSSLQSVGLLGRTIDIASNGGVITGRVSSLSLKEEAPLLSIITTAGATIENVDLSQITAVR
jgi:flagellar basal-body rod modification protein FlgD